MEKERKFSESSPGPKKPRKFNLGKADDVKCLVSQGTEPMFVGLTSEGDVIVVVPHNIKNKLIRRLGEGQELFVEEELEDGRREPLVRYVMSKAAADSLRRMYLLASHNRRILR